MPPLDECSAITPFSPNACHIMSHSEPSSLELLLFCKANILLPVLVSESLLFFAADCFGLPSSPSFKLELAAVCDFYPIVYI